MPNASVCSVDNVSKGSVVAMLTVLQGDIQKSTQHILKPFMTTDVNLLNIYKGLFQQVSTVVHVPGWNDKDIPYDNWRL